jgi:hypothetical protein
LEGSIISLPSTQDAVKNKVYNFLKENQNSLFTIKELQIRLEEILTDPIEREYATKKLQDILNIMVLKNIISSTQSKGEIHYLFRIAEKKIYCQRCRKEVVPYISRLSPWRAGAILGDISVFTSRGVRKKCPICGKKLLSKKDKIVKWSCITISTLIVTIMIIVIVFLSTSSLQHFDF